MYLPRIGIGVLAMCWATAASPTGHQSGEDVSDRRALVAALESLIATGVPRHPSHDEGQQIRSAVEAAIARGDREIERLAIRAASPLTVSVSRPVSSTLDLPAIQFESRDVLQLKRPVPYRARVFASLDGGAAVQVQTVTSGKGAGGRVDVTLPDGAAAPGFHVVRPSAEVTFQRRGDQPEWTEWRTLPPVFYAIYDPTDDRGAGVRALVYGPAATPVRDLDPDLGDEPFAAWLSGLLAARRGPGGAPPPDFVSQYCDERTGEAGAPPAPTAICSVTYFQSRGEIGQVWFRTAEIQRTERGIEWVPALPPRFEGMVVHGSAADSSRLSGLPALLDTPADWRPVPDLSIVPADIVVTPSPGVPGTARVTVTVRNVGAGDLHKAMIAIAWGADPAARGSSREFVLDIPARESVDVSADVSFPRGYGFVMAHGLQLTEHSPHETWTPDPTPGDACAFRVVNGHAAPPGYLRTLVDAAGGGCSGR